MIEPDYKSSLLYESSYLESPRYSSFKKNQVEPADTKEYNEDVAYAFLKHDGNYPQQH